MTHWLRRLSRHGTLAAAVLASSTLAAPAVRSNDAWPTLTDGSIVLARHALAPGVGDPPGFDLDDCRTQRNLNADGRAQARALGEAFRERGVAVAEVWSSRWCRARDTAELAFPEQVALRPEFDSFFRQRGQADSQTDGATKALARWRGPGVLVVVSHQVNITALTGVYPDSGEAVWLRFDDGQMQLGGRWRPASLPGGRAY